MRTVDEDVEQHIHAMGEALQAQLAEADISDPVMVGIHTGGVWVAERLHQQLGIKEALGTLDISFYRDDFTRVGMNPQVKPSALPFSIENRHLILVDDVLHTGRTIRAAMNELFDYGRPASIWLAVLVERDGRELPIAADVAALNIHLARGEQIKLNGPEPLSLIIFEAK
ncbi:bifunctional pyr operon transcriptional regulator/uracil phosphoribosyltransferase PyrR [Sulfuriflexus sp.]|uniref:bifunctional pyr operon transcriptional regulator/uracil phosphoribosyltransferase PyrR n=1 Tax=Sulfuriflexus sp. TaxID=2015443 RepID=UPI0028CCBADE|nr:bifunctional pyr operon transcriptional regulator/uracil phosphoribosyltransferase PyrR [Sulfuriflexus sp.]MDT8403139.1 bifunctional pyr operon transcriptional regulator/uracil phosphoribosyltransferase PyrR [Sulfuriflexus sp.]